MKGLIYLAVIINLWAYDSSFLVEEDLLIGRSNDARYDIGVLEFRTSIVEGLLNINCIDEVGIEWHIAKFDKGAEVVDIYFEEISGDNIKEIIVISKDNNGKVNLNLYSLAFDDYGFYSYDLESLSKSIEITDNYRKEDIIEELSKVEEFDVNGLENWTYGSDIFYEEGERDYYKKFDFVKGEIIAYYDEYDNEVPNREKAKYYIKRYRKNLYGKFINDGVFRLVEVFEGLEVEEFPYYIKNGRYSYYDGNMSIDRIYSMDEVIE